MADGAAPSGHRIVIFAGQHADLPIQAADGPAIAGTIGTSPAIPTIIDTRQMTVSERTRFFTGFAETPVRTNQGELTVIRRSIAGGQAVLSFPALIIDRPADWLPIGTASVKSGGTQGGEVGRQHLMPV